MKIVPKLKVGLMYLGISVAVLMIIGIPWIALGIHRFTITFTIGLGLILFIFMPIAIKYSLLFGEISINEYKITYYIMVQTEKIVYLMQEIDIGEIQDVKIVKKKEILKYDRECKAHKILLFDLGNDRYKHIIITMYTKKQIQQIINTVTKMREQLRNDN